MLCANCSVTTNYGVPVNSLAVLDCWIGTETTWAPHDKNHLLLSVFKLLLQMWVELLLAHHLLVHHLLLLARVHHLLLLAGVHHLLLLARVHHLLLLTGVNHLLLLARLHHLLLLASVHHLLLLARVHHLLLVRLLHLRLCNSVLRLDQIVRCLNLLHLHILILSHYYLAHTYLSRTIQCCAARKTESTCLSLGVSTNRTIHLVHFNSHNI